MLEQMKKIARQSADAAVPMALMFGTVTAVSPLTVRVDSRFDLSGAALLTMAGTALEAGDSVVLLRNHGGQQFLVLGRA